MARDPARYMMSALARDSNEEDRLSELFACVLNADLDLRGALLDRLGLGDRTVQRVQTQMETGVPLRTMDMHFSLAVGGLPAGEVWFEHKLKNDFNPGQLDRYGEALAIRRGGVEVRLQLILGEPPTPSDAEQLDRMDAQVLMWNDIADVVECVLVQRDRDWYRAATLPGAPVELRVLAELAVYLQENAGVAVTGPMDADKLGALAHIEAARKVEEALLARVAERLHPHCVLERLAKYDEAWAWLSVVGWWNDMPEGTLYLWIAPTARCDVGADRTPSLGVSVHVPAAMRPRLESERGFIDALDAAGLRLDSYEKTLIDLSASVPLSTVVAEANLGRQADELARFAGRTIARLFDCVPQGANPTARPPEQALVSTLDPAPAPWRARWQ